MADKEKTPDAGTSGAVVARDDNTAPATSTPENLEQRAPATWADLPVPDEEESDIPLRGDVPAEITNRSDNARDVAAWEAEQDPPLTHEELLGLLALCAHSAITAVDNLPDGDPSVDPLFVAHLATLVYLDRLHPRRVVDRAADAAARATAKTTRGDELADKFAVLLGTRTVWHPAEYGLLVENFAQALQALKKRGGATRPVISAKQPDRQAWFVVREFMRSGRLSARDERTFFYNGQPVPLATIHAHVRRVLSTACLLNLGNMTEVHIDSHVVNEATIALAQRLHDPGLGLVQPGPVMRVVEALPAPAVAESPFAVVYELVPDSWTSSVDIRAAWVKHLGLGRPMTAAEDGKFFRALVLWAGGRVQRGQLHGGKRGYHGLRVR